MAAPLHARAPEAHATALPRDPRALRYVLGASGSSADDHPATPPGAAISGVDGHAVTLERRAREALDSGGRSGRRRRQV